MLVDGFENLTDRYGMNWEKMDLEDAIAILVALAVSLSELVRSGESAQLHQIALNLSCDASSTILSELRELDKELTVDQALRGISSIAALIPAEEIESISS